MATFEERITKITELYASKHKHAGLFSPKSSGMTAKGWETEWFDESFLQILKSLNQGATIEDLVKLDLMKCENDGIFSFPMFKQELCTMILEEMDNFLESGLPIIRPNTMNNYGLILNTIGMREMLTELQQEYLSELCRALFPVEASQFDDHHSFIVSYSSDKDLSLDMHTDASDVTVNVCLGNEGFVGSGLTFCGNYGASNHRHLTHRYQHVIGRAVVHLGRRRHGADVISGGVRNNLIIWNVNSAFRQSDAFRAAMEMQKEEKAPHLECLSWTHDRDFGAYLEYPKGRDPHTAVGGNEADKAKPWCPPRPFCYDGMEPIFARIVERLERIEADGTGAEPTPGAGAGAGAGAVAGSDTSQGSSSVAAVAGTNLELLIATIPVEPNYSRDELLIGRKVEVRLGDVFEEGTLSGVHYDGTFDVDLAGGTTELFIARDSVQLV